MSIEVYSRSGSLGQFASNKGYSDLIAASQKDPVLRPFFDNANTDNPKEIAAVADRLGVLAEKAPEDVASTAKELQKLIQGQSLVFITNGTS